MPLAVKVGEVATPVASVVAVVESVEPGKVPLGPLKGAVKVTVRPGAGLPLASRTVTFSGEASGVVTNARCWDPALTVTDPDALGSFVSEKSAGCGTPAAVAVTR